MRGTLLAVLLALCGVASAEPRFHHPAPFDPNADKEGKAHAFSAAQPHGAPILFFHDKGQTAHANPAIRAVADRLRAAGGRQTVWALPWEHDPGAARVLVEGQAGPIVVSGHGAGHAFALDLARRFPDKVKAVPLVDEADVRAVVADHP